MYQHKDLEFIKATATDVLYKKHLKLVFDTYYNIFGEVCTGCASKISGYIKRLKNFNTTENMSDKKTKEQEKPNFILKKGFQIMQRGKSETFSNANLTDKIAIAFLKKNPNRKIYFVKLPENIDAILSEEVDENGKDKALEDYSFTELKEMYPDAKGRSKDNLLESIQDIISEAAANAESEEVDENGTSKPSDEEE